MLNRYLPPLSQPIPRKEPKNDKRPRGYTPPKRSKPSDVYKPAGQRSTDR